MLPFELSFWIAYKGANEMSTHIHCLMLPHSDLSVAACLISPAPPFPCAGGLHLLELSTEINSSPLKLLLLQQQKFAVVTVYW